MISRVYVEKLPEFALEADRLKHELTEQVGIGGLTGVRLIDRYQVEGLTPGELAAAEDSVFCDRAVEHVLRELPSGEETIFGAEYLPGQFDQQADSAAATLRLQTGSTSPKVDVARVYVLSGNLTGEEVSRIKEYLINPVDSREVDVHAGPASRPEPGAPAPTESLTGFIDASPAQIAAWQEEWGLAMDAEDLEFTRVHFASEGRNPTETELAVIDTYWSDHCRHTTFLTELTDVQFEDPRAEATFKDYLRVRENLGRTKPVSLMDLGTIAAKHLREAGKLDGLDESEEINACTVKINVNVDGKDEPWLLLFKNETHNHPTEIEPFGGAGTCLGGAIRDPLSGRSYVYQAMRVTGSADPTAPIEETLPGKLPQRQIVNQAADGYSTYGNQIGLPAGLVEEVYHPGYLAKRMEVGAVVGAAPIENVVRESPAAGDKIVLLGGKTGRDGCGGATGSSKTHTEDSAMESGPEVQKGNAPEERKIQRLFRNPEAAKLIKRSNDFGAGGVSVAIGELAPGLQVDLDLVPVKYPGLTGTELAISESQERMAVVLDAADVDDFLALAAQENLEATVVAEVTKAPRLVLTHGGQKIVDLPRSFLDTNGVPKSSRAAVSAPQNVAFPFADGPLEDALKRLASDLNIASQEGLVQRFDSTAGAGTVLMPLGGETQLTGPQAMAALIPVLEGTTSTASVMAYGFNPALQALDPYAGSYLAVVESLAKLVATGAPLTDAYLSFQEYFPRLEEDPLRWGQPVAALLGALKAQLDLEVAAVGGKDSMSGTFEDLDVPPTLISFAVTTANAGKLISPEFKKAGSRVSLLAPVLGPDGLPTAASLQDIWTKTLEGIHSGQVLSAWTPGAGGVAEGLLKMSFGNRIGVDVKADAPLFSYRYGSMLLETTPDFELGVRIGETTREYSLARGGDSVNLDEVQEAWSSTLEDVFPTEEESSTSAAPVPTVSFTGEERAGAPRVRNNAQPRFLIPVFPGTNSEYETARAVEQAGGIAEVFVVRDLTPADTARSAAQFAGRLKDSQALLLPGGSATGDEPGGAAKYVDAFFRQSQVAAELTALLDDRGGLVGGFANGFQALVRLGLLPHGKISEQKAPSLALTENVIGRHQSRIVYTRVSSTLSPWFAGARVGDVSRAAFSASQGRLVAAPAQLEELAARGQIAAQYVDAAGTPSMNVRVNPAGSAWAVEALSSPDGRVFGQMTHPERLGELLHRNVPGTAGPNVFANAVKFLRQ